MSLDGIIFEDLEEGEEIIAEVILRMVDSEKMGVKDLRRAVVRLGNHPLVRDNLPKSFWEIIGITGGGGMIMRVYLMSFFGKLRKGGYIEFKKGRNPVDFGIGRYAIEIRGKEGRYCLTRKGEEYIGIKRDPLEFLAYVF